MTPAGMCCPHPEERALRASRRMATRVHAAILRDAAKWPLLRMRAEHDAEVFPPSSFRDASLGAGPKSMTPAGMCCPHPEERALRASRRMATRVHAAILRDAARWPLLRMRAEHDAEVFPPSSFRDAPLGAAGIHNPCSDV